MQLLKNILLMQHIDCQHTIIIIQKYYKHF